jgi:hypothetical protein
MQVEENCENRETADCSAGVGVSSGRCRKERIGFTMMIHPIEFNTKLMQGRTLVVFERAPGTEFHVRDSVITETARLEYTRCSLASF